MKSNVPTVLLAAALSVVLTGADLPPERVIELDVIFTNDIHGGIGRLDATFMNPEFPPPIGAGPSATTYLKKVREEAAAGGREVFLFDSGDMFQGKPVGMYTEGEAVIDWMNDVGYTAAALGNHDFDLGWKVTRNLIEQADFPVMALNVYDAATGEKVPWMDTWMMKEVEGIKIAILGYVTEATVNMAFAENVEGLEFRPIHEVLPGDIEVANAAGADLVFVLMHNGLPYWPEHEREFALMLERIAAGDFPHANMNAMEIAHYVPGIDALFGGHIHYGYRDPWEDPVNHTLCFQGFANGSGLGHVTLRIDRETKSILGYEGHTSRAYRGRVYDREGTLITLFEEEHWPDPGMEAEIAAKVAKAEEGLDEVIGETDVYLGREGTDKGLMGFVVADAYRERLSADFAIQNSGGVRADLPVGKITERDVITVSPFDNNLVWIEVTGAFLKQLLEDKVRRTGIGLYISGGKVVVDPARPENERIVEMTVGGEPLDPDRMYKLVLTNYLAQGNSGLWRIRDEYPAEKINYTGIPDAEAIKDYIRRRGTIDPRNDGRLTIVQGS